ncbi:MAG TPA: ABC transporter permease [Thermoanaerobaculia bacterium]
MQRLTETWPVHLLFAAGGALLIFALVLWSGGADVPVVLEILLVRSFGSLSAWTETLVKATPILLCAIGAALAARSGLINIGTEGQLLIGAVAATAVAQMLATDLRFVMLLSMGAAAMLAGGAWGFLPGVLRTTAGANETVVSLLLNYIAGLLLLYLIHGAWKDPASLGWAQTPTFRDAARLPLVPGTRVHVLFAFGVVAAALLAVAYRTTTWGLSARIVEASSRLAAYSGLNVAAVTLASFVAGGAIAGLAGFGEVAAIHGRLREGVSPGYGYAGFLVAWLCRGRFEWLPVAAVALGGVIAAGDSLQVFSGLPFATTSILQGLLFVSVLIAEAVRARNATRAEVSA